MKMMTVGLGKQAGAYVAHAAGDDFMPERLFSIGSEIIRKANILFGIGLWKTPLTRHIKLHSLKQTKFLLKNLTFLMKQKQAMGKIFLDACDVIILGKNRQKLQRRRHGP